MTTAIDATPQAPSWTFDGIVRLTRVGTSFLIFTLVIGFAALNTGNNALYIGLTFLLGCLLLSGIASKGGLRHLTVELEGIDDAWAGAPVGCMLRVANRSRIWDVRDVVITSAELADPVIVPLAPKRDAVRVNAAFVFQRRGIVELKTADLYTRYPFGFFLKKRRVRLGGEVVVYPRLLPREGTRARFKPIIGEEVSANRPGPGTEIHSFREYVPGDSFRHVYWKKSASIGRWIVKQTDLEAARVVHVVVDPFKPASSSDDDFEEMISAATTFLYHATKRGLTVILSLPNVSLHATDSGAAAAMFRALALVEPSGEAFGELIDRNSVVFSLRKVDEQQEG